MLLRSQARPPPQAPDLAIPLVKQSLHLWARAPTRGAGFRPSL